MKPLIKNIIIKVIVAVVLCTALSLCLDLIMPVFNNDVAMGQLDNTNEGFVEMKFWHTIQNSFTIAEWIIMCVCGILVSVDVYKIIKTKNSKTKHSEENKNEEKIN